MRSYIVLFALLACLGPFALAKKPCCAKQDSKTPESVEGEEKKPPRASQTIEKILSKMNQATKELKSCQAKLSYLFIQSPELWDSKTLQTGMLYYQKNNQRSQLRIRFDDIKQEDFEPEKRREEFLFDGVWLTRIDFKLKQIDRIQKAPKDAPIGVFDLISHSFPLVGFSNIEQLSKDFDIRMPQKTDESDKSIRLLLNVKKDSKYKNEYKKIDFWADAKTYMPQRIIAYSSQGDIYDIKFTELKINKKLKNAIFNVETPSDFRKNIESLEEKPVRKGSK